MAPVMEGTHTVLVLYVPIHELSNISLYFPRRRAAPSFKYENRTPRSGRNGNDHGWEKEDHAVSEQRGQSSNSSCKLLNSQATKEAVAELCWLAAEHHQLLADLLSLCRECTNKVKMGNQNGKIQDYVEAQDVASGGQVLSSSRYSPEQTRAPQKSRKENKKSAGKRPDSAEAFLHSQMKKKMMSGATSSELPQNSVSVCVSDTSATTSYVHNPTLSTEEPLQTTRESWDFMEDTRAFDPDVDFCNDFSDSELGYESSSCSLMEGLNRRESGSNLRPEKKIDSVCETFNENGSVEMSQSVSGVRVVAKVQEVHGKVQHVHRSSPDVQVDTQSSSPQRYGEWTGPNGTSKKPSGGLWLPLSHTTEPLPPAKAPTKSPSSPSLAAVFNTSFPATNSLQSMSPVPSPLSSKQPSPQLNHRIVLLSDQDVDPERDSSSNTDEPKIFTEVIDKNGNKRTVTRLDLNLSRRPSNSKWNSSSNSTTTGELMRNHLILHLDVLLLLSW